MGIQMSQILYGLIGFTFVFIALGTVYFDMVTDYDVSPDQFSESFNKINETHSLTQDINSQIYNSQTSSTNALDAMLSGAFGAIRLVFSSFSLIHAIVDDIAKEIGIPGWIITTFLSVVLLVIAFAAINAIFRTGRT